MGLEVSKNLRIENSNTDSRLNLRIKMFILQETSSLRDK